MRSFEFVQSLQKVPEYVVLEGDTINLICRPMFATDSDKVEIVGNTAKYVIDGGLIHSLEGNIAFTKNESVAILTIYNITHDDGDVFICRTPAQYLTIKVLYTPVDYPRLTSNYTPQYVCDDGSRGPFQFNCTTEAGDPPVNMTLYIEKEGEILSINTVDFNIKRMDNFIHLSFVTYLNSSFNDARLVCSINQQLPAPYENYRKSSFIDLSPRALLHINPSNYTITKENEVISLTCTSNINGSLLEWRDIPFGDTRYNTSSVTGSIQLIIFEYGSNFNGSMTVQCRSSCGGRVISQGVTISLTNEILERKNENGVKMQFNLVAIVSSLITTAIIISISVFVVLRCKTKRGRLRVPNHSSTSSHVYHRSIAMQGSTTQDISDYCEITDEAKFKYDQELYLVPDQHCL